MEEDKIKEEQIRKEESAQYWERYVRSEVNSLLNIYLSNSKSGTVGVQYKHPVTKSHPGYDEWDETKASGVEIKIVFDFEEIIDKPNG
jgi:hypothetical protein